jgi:hypothetical protein
VNRRIKLALGGVGIAAVALAVFFMLINPMRVEISTLRVQRTRRPPRSPKLNRHCD